MSASTRSGWWKLPTRFLPVGMSIAVSGGLTVCTVFTTIVVPVVYLFLDDVQNWFLGAMRKAFDDLAVIARKTGETIEPSGS